MTLRSAARQAWVWREFETSKALAKALSAEVSAALRHHIEIYRGTEQEHTVEKVLAVSGGTTPKAFFNELARADVSWRQVVVTLCDERFVPPSSPRSNEWLVRRELLQHRAKAARFVPLHHDAATVSAAADLADEMFQSLAASVVVLGMGLDGHTASLFPDAAEIADALDPDRTRDIIAIHSPSASEPRISMTLQAINTAWDTFLHIEGDAKREAFERAMRSEPVLPIRAIVEGALHTCGQPVEVFWAP